MTRHFLLRLIMACAIAAVAAMGIALRPATAATLKADVIVDGDIVTLGDLFEGAGALGAEPVFRSPDLGVEGELPAAAALQAAIEAGLQVDPTMIDNIRVVRRSVLVDAVHLEMLLKAEVAGRLKSDPANVTVTFDGAVPAIAANGTALNPATIASLQIPPEGGRFLATISVDVGTGVKPVSLRGLAVETVEIPVLTRAVSRRELLQSTDIAFERVDRRRVAPGAITDPAAIIGMAARRPLRAGVPVALVDIEPPRVVLRGELVTIVFEKPGMTLTARGRALADAAVGETVSVLNEHSRRTVQATASAPGIVRIEVGTALAAALPAPVVTQ